MKLARIGNERGAGGIGCLLILLVVGGGMYAGVQLYLPQFRNTSFQERLNETYPYFSRQPADVIRRRIIDTAAEFDIPLKPEQVKIAIEGDHLQFDIDYVKEVDLKVMQKSFPFHIHRSGPY